MKFLIFTFLITLSTVFSISAQAQFPGFDFKPEQLKFDFVSSDGSFWYDCTHKKEKEPHAWTVTCSQYTFNLHLFLTEYQRTNEATYEFHFWADEVKALHETHTQSIWLTVDKNAVTKKILAYMGFQQDAIQLRLQVNLNGKFEIKPGAKLKR